MKLEIEFVIIVTRILEDGWIEGMAFQHLISVENNNARCCHLVNQLKNAIFENNGISSSTI